MFLVDCELILFLFVFDLYECWKDELVQHGFQAERRETLVQDRMHGGLVVGADRC